MRKGREKNNSNLSLRVVFSKDQTFYIRGWKMDDSDLDKIRTTRAVGHNSG